MHLESTRLDLLGTRGQAGSGGNGGGGAGWRERSCDLMSDEGDEMVGNFQALLREESALRLKGSCLAGFGLGLVRLLYLAHARIRMAAVVLSSLFHLE